MAIQTADAPYIATHRPEPPPLSSMTARHYHLVYTGERGKCITQARWTSPEDAAMWAAAFRAPPEGDDVAIDGSHYLTRFGVDPATGQPQRCAARAGAQLGIRQLAAGSHSSDGWCWWRSLVQLD